MQAYLRHIPVTAHVTIGADITHNHPACAPARLGKDRIAISGCSPAWLPV
jgi:hypothetical protein